MLRRIILGLRTLVRRTAVDQELNEELRSHIDRAIARNVERGMTAVAARHAAQREFGNFTAAAEDARAAWQWRWAEELRQDVRYALRSMRRRPTFTAVAVSSIALGTGAAVALFAVLDSTLLRRLPVREPSSLVSSHGGSYPLYRRLQTLDRVFSDVAAVSLLDRSNITLDGSSAGPDGSIVRVALVSGNYFTMLGVSAVIGRTLTTEDDRAPGGHPVAVISDGYWRTRFGGLANALGRTLALNGTTYTVIGVAPRAFTGDATGRPVDVWLSVMMQSQVMLEMPGLLERNNGWLRIVARLRPGVTVAQAKAAVQPTYRENEIAFAGADATPLVVENLRRTPFELVPIERGYARSRDALQRSLTILMAIVATALVIACANIAGLQLTRAEARGREMAIRLAIGAARARLVRQLLTESVMVAVAGGALGLALAHGVTMALSTTMSVGPVQMDARAPSSWLSLDASPQAGAYVLAAGLSLISGILVGLAPAIRGSRAALAPALVGRGASAGSSPDRARIGRLFVVAQVALTLVLIIVTSLFVRTLRNLEAEPLGVNRERLLLVWTTPGQAGHSGERLPDFVRMTLDAVARIPGVVSASATNHGVLEGEDAGSASELLAVAVAAPKPGLTLMRDAVTPGFFQTSGTPLLEGRDLTERDVLTTSHAAVVNQTMSRFFFGDASAIGHTIGSGDAKVEIVGVVRDVKHGSPRDRRGIWYVSYRQFPNLLRNMCIVIQTAGDPAAVAGDVRRVLHELDPLLPILRINTIDEQLGDALAQERLVATLSLGFGGFTLLLACIGLYGVVANAVARRTNEIGIRMALGASRGAVVGMVLRDTASIVIAGIAIGTPLALVARSLIASRLYGVGVSDPATVVAVASVLVGVTAVAGLLPAYRAARIDPNVALRYE